MTPIPTIYGFKVPTQADRDYMDYLDGLYDAPDYGLLVFKGDPTAFEVGRHEWQATQLAIIKQQKQRANDHKG